MAPVTSDRGRSELGRHVPTIRGGPLLRWGFLVGGLFVFALGIVLMVESGLGLSPWDVLHQGIARHTPLSIGTANAAVAAVVVVLAWRLGARIGPGTLANAILVGVFVDLLLRAGPIRDLATASLGVRAVLLAGGIALIALATPLYIGAGLGAGARDSLMLALTRRTSRRVGIVRTAIETVVVAIGFALGGTVGIGTLAFALGIGPAVEGSFALLARSPLAARPSQAPPERRGSAPVEALGEAR